MATCWRSLVLWVVSKQSVAEFLLCAECRVVTVYLSENDTERYVKAHVVVKLQLDHKLAHRKSARRLHKKPQKEHVLARRRQHCNIDPQKAHVVRGVRRRETKSSRTLLLAAGRKELRRGNDTQGEGFKI